MAAIRPAEAVRQVLPPGCVMVCRCPACSRADALSQVTHRVWGPLPADRVLVVVDDHWFAHQPAGTLAQIVARNRVTVWSCRGGPHAQCPTALSPRD
jgi:hypothetical protein